MSSTGLDRVEVTTVAANQKLGDGKLSLGLQISDPFADPVYSFSSREAAEAMRPRLVLELTDASLPFADWIVSYTNLVDLAPGADPDGDGLTNAEEFLYFLDPSQPESASPLQISALASGISLKFPQRKRLPAGFYYVIETTPSLSSANWQSATGVEFSRTDEVDSVRIHAYIPAASTQEGFYRLRIAIGP
jgi:hypothetical protein